MFSRTTQSKVLRDGVQVVMDRQDGLALALEVVQDFNDRFLGSRVDRGERFIHEVELRVLGQGPREEHTLLLPPG